jgi:clan AA aspartic protease (TIGR02281 family)
MVGEIFRDGASYRYREFIRDASKGGQIAMDMRARCVADNVATQPGFPRMLNETPPIGSEIVRMVGDGGTFKVPVTINGQLTLDFIVDSGAADVSIPADVVLTLIRTGTIAEEDFLGARTYTMADGSTVPSQRFLIRSLKVGDKVLENVTASIAPVAGSLLLGQSFLTRFKSWSIDNQRQALVLN